MGPTKNLVVVFGDQLDAHSAAFDGFDPRQDAVLMMEVRAESEHVPSHKHRTAFFLSAMRHFANAITDRGWRLRYTRLSDPKNTHTLQTEMVRACADWRPARLVAVRPGEWRVLHMLEQAAHETGVTLEIRPDRHFLVGIEEFAGFAKGRRSLRMEHFYRWQRRRLGILVAANGEPEGGRWNFDADNRESLAKTNDVILPPPPRRFPPDEITREVLAEVNRWFPNNPGSVETFDWPVTASDAAMALDDFIENRLALFGRFQDAMLAGQPCLFHSRLAACMNLKLLNPRTVVARVLDAYRSGRVGIESAEGFIRQIIGWREFIRGVYWTEGPDYGQRNSLGASGRLPSFYWTGKTAMRCMAECISQTLSLGYAHHIQRLMVTGNFALISGVHPAEVDAWYLAVYTDAVEWVTLPNTHGMVMHADGGVVGSKPYAASGKYIQRMSDYCRGCQYSPAARTGPRACPFNVFYWDFLLRHADRFRNNPRMAMVMRNAERIPAAEKSAIRRQADALRREFGITD
jgi:deoxyribodipyrimidine photolyase-related protein